MIGLIMNRKQMPYKIDEETIERAKYRAKIAIREVARPTEQHRTCFLRKHWIGAIAATVIIGGVFGFVKLTHKVFHPTTPIEQLISEMQTAPDEIIYDLLVDRNYYSEEENTL